MPNARAHKRELTYREGVLLDILLDAFKLEPDNHEAWTKLRARFVGVLYQDGPIKKAVTGSR